MNKKIRYAVEAPTCYYREYTLICDAIEKGDLYKLSALVMWNKGKVTAYEMPKYSRLDKDAYYKCEYKIKNDIGVIL